MMTFKFTPLCFGPLLAMLLALCPLHASADDKTTEAVESARSLILRITPAHASQFRLKIIPSHNGQDVFVVRAADKSIEIAGNNAVALASGYNYYIKYMCQAHVGYIGGRQMKLPAKLPLPPKSVRVVSPHRIRYILNDCTFAYTYPWASWEEWERDLDWMAMNGYNVFELVTGWEAVWSAVLPQLGMTEAEARDFCGFPAWCNWMGAHSNMGGAISAAQTKARGELAVRIVRRARELGMEPAPRMFYGIVPHSMRKKHPSASIINNPSWHGQAPTSFLEPTDPFYEKVAKVFFETQSKVLGFVPKYYMADPVNEAGFVYANRPQPFVNKVVGRMEAPMRKHSPEAVWIMSSWRVSEKLSRAVDRKRTLVLDLAADADPKWKKTGEFWGTPWVWCSLPNFGGNNGLTGDLKGMSETVAGLPSLSNIKHLQGIGCAPEGGWTTPVTYELLAEMGWRNKPLNMSLWLNFYAHRRYGAKSPQAEKAWNYLLRSVYARPSKQPPYCTVLTARPALAKILKARTWGDESPPYEIKDVVEAWKYLLAASNQCGGSDTYRYDLADVTRQVLTDLARPTWHALYNAYKSGDKDDVALYSQRLLELIEDMDRVVATRREFLLGTWIADARRWGVDKKEKTMMEKNAKVAVTYWLPGNPRTSLRDYANRHWAGLINDFYGGRWKIFIEALKQPSEKKALSDIANRIIEFEENWVNTPASYSTEPKGDTVKECQAVWSKYRRLPEYAPYFK